MIKYNIYKNFYNRGHRGRQGREEKSWVAELKKLFANRPLASEPRPNLVLSISV